MKKGEAVPLRRRFLIVHNPIAGRNRIGLVQEVVRHLVQAGAHATLHVRSLMDGSSPLPDAPDSFDALIAAGGDGTVRSLLPLLEGTKLPFGLIPVGTGNVLAEELQLPRAPARIARMLLDGPVAELSTPSVNGAPFLLMLGAGFDGEVVARLPMALKRRVGKPAFAWPTLAALARKPLTFGVNIDGRSYETSWLIVANAGRYGGSFILTRRTDVLSPGFDVLISRATDRRQRLAELFHLAAGRAEGSPTIEMVPARMVEIHDGRELAVQVDGEPIASPSFSIIADAARTPMIVPAPAAGSAHS